MLNRVLLMESLLSSHGVADCLRLMEQSYSCHHLSGLTLNDRHGKVTKLTKLRLNRWQGSIGVRRWWVL